jgi:hypothetical protein
LQEDFVARGKRIAALEAERDALKKDFEEVWYYTDTLFSFLDPDILEPLGPDHVAEIMRGMGYVHGIMRRLYTDGALSAKATDDEGDDGENLLQAYIATDPLTVALGAVAELICDHDGESIADYETLVAARDLLRKRWHERVDERDAERDAADEPPPGAGVAR